MKAKLPVVPGAGEPDAAAGAGVWPGVADQAAMPLFELKAAAGPTRAGGARLDHVLAGGMGGGPGWPSWARICRICVLSSAVLARVMGLVGAAVSRREIWRAIRPSG